MYRQGSCFTNWAKEDDFKNSTDQIFSAATSQYKRSEPEISLHELINTWDNLKSEFQKAIWDTQQNVIQQLKELIGINSQI